MTDVRRNCAVPMQFSTRHGVAVVDVRVDGDAVAWSLVTAVRNLDRVGVTAVRVLDGDVMALPDIAERSGLDRETVRQLLVNAGPGGSPPPVSPGRRGTVFYRWVEMAPWLRERAGVAIPEVNPVLSVANLMLQARQLVVAGDPLIALLDRDPG